VCALFVCLFVYNPIDIHSTDTARARNKLTHTATTVSTVIVSKECIGTLFTMLIVMLFLLLEL